MSWPQAHGTDLVWMTCYAEAHRDYGNQQRWVPFLEAIHDPPLCHDQPMLTEGGRRMWLLARRWRENGPVLDCRFSGKGEGQGVSCYSHGWSGVYHDLTWTADGYEEHCPSYPIAAWLTRRAGLRASTETPRP